MHFFFFFFFFFFKKYALCETVAIFLRHVFVVALNLLRNVPVRTAVGERSGAPESTFHPIRTLAAG